MATALAGLTLAEFEAQYSHQDKAYEFWYGEAVPKGMPTWIHGLLQKILMLLLDEAGYASASEVELRIIPEAHPRPDVIAVRKLPAGKYPTKGVDVVVEILSEDDPFQHLREKCRKYQEWGCGAIYVVDPADRSISRWDDGSLLVSAELAGIAATDIWAKLDASYQEKQ